jgi:hypothetical protein
MARLGVGTLFTGFDVRVVLVCLCVLISPTSRTHECSPLQHIISKVVASIKPGRIGPGTRPLEHAHILGSERTRTFSHILRAITSTVRPLQLCFYFFDLTFQVLIGLFQIISRIGHITSFERRNSIWLNHTVAVTGLITEVTRHLVEALTLPF